MSKEAEAGGEVYGSQQREGSTEEIYEEMAGKVSKIADAVEVLDERLKEGRTKVPTTREASEARAEIVEGIEKGSECGSVHSGSRSKDVVGREEREPRVLENEHLQNQREDLDRDFGTELLIGRSVMQDSQGLTDEQAKALALITRDLSSLVRIIAEPAMQYPIRTNEAAATVGEELLTMERTARALQDVPERL